MAASRIVTYNVNGLRAACSKGWLDWLRSVDPDIVLLQEIKTESGQVDTKAFEELGYLHFWHSAEKKGYSGVALFSKQEPQQVVIGSGNPEIDREGRIIRADFDPFSVMSVYVPSGSSGDLRQSYKMEWLEWFRNYIAEVRGEQQKLIIGGDVNICHRAIDIHNPVSNAKSSGFLPEEREWMESFLNDGFIDTFRHFNTDPHHYTWWSYRSGARSRNLGWRIDYLLATENLKQNLKRSVILPDAKHSDHCPVLLEVNH
jgi:exodeoxyribonuclease-3